MLGGVGGAGVSPAPTRFVKTVSTTTQAGRPLRVAGEMSAMGAAGKRVGTTGRRRVAPILDPPLPRVGA